MQRRRFLSQIMRSCAALAAAPFAARATARYAAATPLPAPLHLQDCRIAGSHHYDCHDVLPLRIGDPLRLRRQPDNPHDARAVEVSWRGHKLGYLPRLDNAAAASLIDRAHALHAEIIGIDNPGEEWEPVKLRVWVNDSMQLG